MNENYVIYTPTPKHGLVEAIAYNACNADLEEIGAIQVRNEENGCCHIEFFGVKEANRRTGIGRKLLEAVLKKLHVVGITKVLVYPHPESFSGEDEMNANTLYDIYEALGFILDDNSADRNRPGHVMVRNVK